jgi:hypothetical protein
MYVQAGSAGQIVWGHRIVLQANLLLRCLRINAQSGVPIKVNDSPSALQAKTRAATRNLQGLTVETPTASICLVTFMEPNSAPMPAAARPLTTKAAIIEPD